MIRACFTLPKANDTEHPFALSIHGAWMLRDGIRQFAESTRQLFEKGMEDACYSSLRVQTAIKQATMLREWLVEVEPDYLESTIKDVDALLAELAADRDRFAALLELAPDDLENAIKDVDALLAEPASGEDPFAALFVEERSRRATEGDDVPPEMDH